MGQSLRTVIDQVQSEIDLFRDEVLPRILDNLSREFCCSKEPLNEWQCEIDHLCFRLQKASDFPSKSRSDSAIDPTTFGYLKIWNSRIHWLFESHFDFDAFSMLCDVPWVPRNAEQINSIETCVPTFKKWIAGLPVESSLLHNALATVVACVVEYDSDFVFAILKSATWKMILQHDQSLELKSRKRCKLFVDGTYFHRVLNNGILHAVAGLAVNQFKSIPNYLDHPSLIGPYTHLIPKLIFSALQRKVAVVEAA